MSEPRNAAPADLPLHPRPQLTRERWDDLGGVWPFAHDDEDRGLLGRWFERGDVFDQEADRTHELDPERVRAITSQVSRAVPHDVLQEIHALADERRLEQLRAEPEGEVPVDD